MSLTKQVVHSTLLREVPKDKRAPLSGTLFNLSNYKPELGKTTTSSSEVDRRVGRKNVH